MNAAAVVISKHVIGLFWFLNSISVKISFKRVSVINVPLIRILSLKFIK